MLMATRHDDGDDDGDADRASAVNIIPILDQVELPLCAVVFPKCTQVNRTHARPAASRTHQELNGEQTE